MFFCTGVDRKNVLLAREYIYIYISNIMTISVLQHSEKVLIYECEK